ncbi:Protein kinase C-like phorbol ester/diacylglycerol-binding domain [Trinorchestia longiramus]|nr:Protein kinase C-like phorbol ester/diacylglycerol-binding domain [Trinorchestia longiramus]
MGCCSGILSTKIAVTWTRVFETDISCTVFQVHPGRSLRYALSKALSLRKLSPELCAVYRAHPKTLLSWDQDIALVEGDEIIVELKEKFPVTTSISHNFIRRTFFSLAFCDSCRKLLFHGFVCRTCGYRFHQRCSLHVPSLCQQDHRMANNIYQHIAPYSDQYCPVLLHETEIGSSGGDLENDSSVYERE